MILVLAKDFSSYKKWMNSKGIPLHTSIYTYWCHFDHAISYEMFTLVLRLKDYEQKPNINDYYKVGIERKFVFVDVSDDVI